MPNSRTPPRPSACGAARLLDGGGDGQAVDAGHRLDRRAAVQPALDEQRQHQVAGVQARLAHEVAQRARAAQAPQPGLRKGHALERIAAGSGEAAQRERARSRRSASREREEVRERAEDRLAVSLSVRSSASSVGLNGNSAETTWMTSYSPSDTVPLGTSARKAIGSESRNASSDAARTSRASPPMATPSALKASAPAEQREQPQRRLRPRDRDERAQPATISAASANAHSAASTTFSASSSRRVTRPRTSRPNACSSRSSASIPAASRTVTNMSETVTATATA